MNAKTITKLVGALALALTLVPPILNATDKLGDAAMKGAMLVGCILWFVSAPMFMKESRE